MNRRGWIASTMAALVAGVMPRRKQSDVYLGRYAIRMPSGTVKMMLRGSQSCAVFPHVDKSKVTHGMSAKLFYLENRGTMTEALNAMMPAGLHYFTDSEAYRRSPRDA